MEKRSEGSEDRTYADPSSSNKTISRSTYGHSGRSSREVVVVPSLGERVIWTKNEGRRISLDATLDRTR